MVARVRATSRMRAVCSPSRSSGSSSESTDCAAAASRISAQSSPFSAGRSAVCAARMSACTADRCGFASSSTSERNMPSATCARSSTRSMKSSRTTGSRMASATDFIRSSRARLSCVREISRPGQRPIEHAVEVRPRRPEALGIGFAAVLADVAVGVVAGRKLHDVDLKTLGEQELARAGGGALAGRVGIEAQQRPGAEASQQPGVPVGQRGPARGDDRLHAFLQGPARDSKYPSTRTAYHDLGAPPFSSSAGRRESGSSHTAASPAS